MARRRQREQTIFFPWEKGGGFLRRSGLARARPFVAALGMALFLLLLGSRERKEAGIRSTRVTLDLVYTGLDAYRADHEGHCPADLADLRKNGYLATAPIDAWGHALRLVCPGRKDPHGYDLLSDGPDGEIGGLDRVE